MNLLPMSLTFIFACIVFLCYPEGSVVAVKVFLTVEEGRSLVGPHCQETVRLFCEGVDLFFLRWSYTSHQETQPMEIKQFLRKDVANNQSKVLNESLAFLGVQLLSVIVNEFSVNSRSANFSSILTADISQLSHQNVTSIICGDVDDIAKINIPEFKINISVSRVIANYQTVRFTSVEVQWMKSTLRSACNVSDLGISYEVTLSGSAPIWINDTNCDEKYCSTSLETDVDHELSGHASLMIRVFDLSMRQLGGYKKMIARHIHEYFVPYINATQCKVAAYCLCDSSCNLTNADSLCSLNYAPTSYSQIDTPTNFFPFNTWRNFTPLDPTTNIYISATVEENNNFYFVVREKFNLGTNYSSMIEHRTIIILGITVLLVIISILYICAFVLLKLFKVFLKKYIQVLSTLTVLMLISICSVLLATFGFLNNKCSETAATHRNNLVESMLVISCLGTTLLLIIWVSMGYFIYKHRRTYKQKCPPKSIRREFENDQLQKVEKIMECQSVERDEYKFHSTNHDFLDSSIKNVNYESLQPQRPKVGYDTLAIKRPAERPLTELHSETYGKLEETSFSFGQELISDGAYTQLRLNEKSKPVPNLLDPTYTHIDKRESLFEGPDLFTDIRRDNMREDYDVLSRQSVLVSSMMDNNEYFNYSFYGTLDEATIEATGAGPYELLRSGQKSKPVPNSDDPSYSHIHIRKEGDEPPAMKQVSSKKWYLKKQGK